MDLLARQFARKVLLAHLAVLVAVALLVLAAARQLYAATRAQVLAQAEKRQELLAGQAARGIEDFYQGIFDNLDILRRSTAEEAEPATTQTANPGSPFRRHPRPIPLPHDRGFSRILWFQLSDRVTQLISFQRADIPALREFMRDHGGATGPNSPRPEPRFDGGRQPAPEGTELIGSADASITPEELAEAAKAEIKARFPATPAGRAPVSLRPFVTGVLELGAEHKRVTLVIVPPNERYPRVFAAVVPVEKIEERFGREPKERLSAVLVDAQGHTIASADPALAGAHFPPVGGPGAPAVAAPTTTATSAVEHEVVVNGTTLPPAIVTVEPLHLEGAKWMLVVSSPLTEVDAIVTTVFRKAFFWTVFVIGAFAGVLTSTAAFMIRNRIRLERQRTEVIHKSLSDARAIQLAWLPGADKVCPGLEVAATNQPAQHISGDFYNWFDAPAADGGEDDDDCRTVILIGDVTGHGMAAAFLMSTTQLLVRNTFPRTNDPGRCLEEVNRQLCVQAFNGQFVTILLMVLDPTTGRAQMAVAGHPPPLLSDPATGAFSPLDVEPQLVLGVDREARYPTHEFTLPREASLVLYTDGVQDLYSPAGDRFTTEGLQRALNGSRPKSARDALSTILAAVSAHRQTAPLGDDLTLVTVHVTRPAAVGRTAAAVGVTS